MAAATGQQGALFHAVQQLRYQAQLTAYGWPLPDDPDAPPTPLPVVDKGYPDPAAEWADLEPAAAWRPKPEAPPDPYRTPPDEVSPPLEAAP